MKILPFRPFPTAAVVEHMRHPSSKRNDAGGTPAGSAILLPGGVKVARRFVKPHGVGASPTLAASFQGALCGADVPAWNREAIPRCGFTLTLSDGWQSSNAPVPKTE